MKKKIGSKLTLSRESLFILENSHLSVGAAADLIGVVIAKPRTMEPGCTREETGCQPGQPVLIDRGGVLIGD